MPLAFFYCKEVNNIKGTLRVNYQIRVPRVRLIDPDGKQIGIVGVKEAQLKAKEAGLDLVEVAPHAEPPVCKIIDFKKFMYEQKRKQRQGKKQQHHTDLKEIKFRPSIDKHDYETKMKKARKFIEQGNKVKITLVYRGRERSHREIGDKLLNQVLKDLDDAAQVDHQVRSAGSHLEGLILSRKK